MNLAARFLLVFVLLPALRAQSQLPSAPGPGTDAPASMAPGPASATLPAPAISAPPGSLLAQGLSALQANQPRQALADFQQALRSAPNDSTANWLAATAALEVFQGSLAVQYAEKARQLDPQSWKIHTTLVAAYAAAGMKRQRDQERATLRQMHANGAPDARKAAGFLLEMFPGPVAAGSGAQPYRVDAVEYFDPVGRFRTFYRFLVRQADGHKVREIDVQSNDFDQKSWAQAHPSQAADGERQFQITGHGDNNQEVDYRLFSGKPDYDTIRGMVVRILQEHPPAASPTVH